MSMEREEDDTRFAATFCAIEITSSVYRSVSSEANALAITSLVFLSMYSPTLSSNTTLAPCSAPDRAGFYWGVEPDFVFRPARRLDPAETELRNRLGLSRGRLRPKQRRGNSTIDLGSEGS
jgi:hypothetical protein